jgi:hypothetical protein
MLMQVSTKLGKELGPIELFQLRRARAEATACMGQLNLKQILKW